MSRQLLTRNDRVAQMTKQEELIAKKKREILEKQKNAEIAKTIAANMSSSNSNATINNLCSGNNCSSIQDINTSNDDTFDNTTNELVIGTDTTTSLSTISPDSKTQTTVSITTAAPGITAATTGMASSTCNSAIRNTFSNDGSFMEKFKKYAEAALSVKQEGDENPESCDMNETG